MNHNIKKFMLISPYNVAPFESWLSDMAASGLMLKKIGMNFCTFEKIEPKKIEFRIDLSKEHIDESRKAMYMQKNWNYLTSKGYAHVFYVPADEFQGELHTDAVEQGFTMIGLMKSLKLTIISLILFTILYSSINILLLFNNDTPYLNLIEHGETYIYSIAAYLIFSTSMIKHYINICSIKKTLFSGEQLDHHTNWIKYKKRQIILNIISCPLIVFMLISIAFTVSDSVYMLTGLNKISVDTKTDIPIIRLTDIEKSYNLDIDLYSAKKETDFSIFTKEQFILEEEIISLDEKYNSGLTIQYYKLRCSIGVNGVLDNLVKRNLETYEEFMPNNIEIEEIEYSGLDEVRLAHVGEFLFIFASKDNVVLSVKYYGTQSSSVILEELVKFL